jgi:sugar lactone lactonase YvrE
MRLYKFIFLLLLFATKVFCQHSFVFNHIKEKDGLSSNFINCFLKDSKGYIWIGTDNGLNRFDGAHFYIFKKGKDSLSLLNNSVHSICEDRNGNIWGATENGIFCYVTKDNTFKNYKTPNSQVAKAVYNILCDRNGDIWATGFWTIVKFNKSTGSFLEIGPLTTNADSLKNYSVRKNGMLEDTAGNGLWFATRMGLHYYNKASGKFSSYKNEISNPLFSNHSVSALARARSGNYWYFDNTTREAITFSPSLKKIVNRISVATVMPNAFGATLYEDNNNTLWFSSWSSEIAVIDLSANNKVSLLRHDKNDALSIAGDFFWAAMEVADNTTWLGTVAGISKNNPSKTIFATRHFAGKIPELGENYTITFLDENLRDKTWWLSTSKRINVQYSPTTDTYKSFDLNKARPDKNGKMPGDIISIRFINSSTVFCTLNGAWEVKQGQHEIVPFQQLPRDYRSFVVVDMVSSDDTTFYLTDAKELLEWNRISGAVIPIKFGRRVMPDGQNAFMSYITKKKGNPLYLVSAFGWISVVRGDTLEHINLVHDQDKELNGFFNSMDIDSKGKIWLAGPGVGLYWYDTLKKTSGYVDEADGLVNNGIQCAVITKTGQIWCSLFNRFSVYTPDLNSFFNFSLPISENNLGYRSWSILLSNGNLLSSINNELVEFFPNRLALKPAISTPLISTVNVSGKAQLINSNLLELEPDQNYITIKFGLLTDKEIFPYSFEYMLEGFDKKWQKIENAEVTFNKLPAAAYKFKLVAAAKNSTWKSSEQTLEIVIHKPFYKTSWFMFLIVLFLTGLIALLYRFRLNKHRQILTLETKAASLEREKTLVQYESLKQHLNPHFLFNSLTSLRSLIKTDTKTATLFLDGMSKVYRYVLKSGQQELVALKDEIEFVKTFTGLQKIRFNKGLQINIDIDEKDFNRYLAPVTLQNLVENAIKHNTANVDNPLMISISVQGEYVIVQNNLQRYHIVETSNKQGLGSLKNLYRYYSEKPVIIEENENYFIVKIPLL